MIASGNTNPCTGGVITGDTDRIRLYDVVTDPSECTNVASSNPAIVLTMMKRYFELVREAEWPNFPFDDPNATPDYYDGCWHPWQNADGSPISSQASSSSNTIDVATLINKIVSSGSNILKGVI